MNTLWMNTVDFASSLAKLIKTPSDAFRRHKNSLTIEDTCQDKLFVRRTYA